AASVSAADRFTDGSCFVDLAALSEPEQITPAIAVRLGVREEADRALSDRLSDYLRKKSLLLLLDNCEHLTAPCGALVTALLQACPDLRILATSRQPLRVPGEQVWRVPSLFLPHPGEASHAGGFTPSVVIASEAAQLFVERAISAYPTFRL